MSVPLTLVRIKRASNSAMVQLLVALMAISICGCPGGSAAETVQPQLAKDTLIKALTAWKNESKVETLQNGSPAIVVQDMDWSAGKQLKEFLLRGDGTAVGANLSIEVELTLMESSGKTSTSNVWYLVGTDPALTVFRDIFH